jgi:hypothetical protein
MLLTTVDILAIAREPVWLIQCDTPIPASFPSPAEDEAGERVDLNTILLPHPTHTYLARVNGTSMDGPPSNIVDGALLAVDCALKPQVGHVVVAAVEVYSPKVSWVGSWVKIVGFICHCAQTNSCGVSPRRVLRRLAWL